MSLYSLKFDSYCNYWVWNKNTRRCYTMSDYNEAFWNNNFVAGWKYCEDVPNRCDCGKVYQPKIRIVGGTEVDVSCEVFALI